MQCDLRCHSGAQMVHLGSFPPGVADEGNRTSGTEWPRARRYFDILTRAALEYYYYCITVLVYYCITDIISIVLLFVCLTVLLDYCVFLYYCITEYHCIVVVLY